MHNWSNPMFAVFATARAYASQEIDLRLHRNFYLYFTLFLSHLGAMLAFLCICFFGIASAV
jgi:hypothetical protein